MKIKNIIFVGLGFFFLGLGVIGIVLPLIPTTPFLLLASYFFVKGSKKFEVWFKGTSIYKQHLESFVKNRSLTLKQKVLINLFADTMIAVAFILAESTIVRTVLVIIIFYKYYYFIYKIKTAKSERV
ncbi:YbaN family protein [Fictibacillus nanhaiensis]|uniref:YbaN family protein n=1 Tax=Fictibacillus nanhaiensis TaxID=742169 RepID=UPI001C950CD2|nr:YbaN family protein [Fictibacillus nanhaiensis]MBY6038191.1 YbaN family protein [Fictibacillus nanhaiensis]